MATLFIMTGMLTPEQISNILHSQSICRIGFIDNLQPYIIPVNYYFDGKHFYCQSQEGMKLKAMRKNPNVCVQVDIINSMNNWQSVLAIGQFEELKGDDADKMRKELYDNILILSTNSKVHSFEHESTTILDDSNRIKVIIFRILISNFFGKFEKQ
jgi:nitroimidazol reductase NimA-like FMN-containing flavoprotein (pyridoxamine 5'-phosphate oxidase superfamily)